MTNPKNARVWWAPTYETTVEQMFRLCRQYAADVDAFNFRDYLDAYLYVRSLPFISDPDGIEMVTRPKYSLNPAWTKNRDCDDKTTALCAFAERRGIQYRFAVVGEERDNARNPHHIYPEFFLDGVWLPMDATYPDRCKMGERLYQERFRRVFGRPS